MSSQNTESSCLTKLTPALPSIFNRLSFSSAFKVTLDRRPSASGSVGLQQNRIVASRRCSENVDRPSIPYTYLLSMRPFSPRNRSNKKKSGERLSVRLLAQKPRASELPIGVSSHAVRRVLYGFPLAAFRVRFWFRSGSRQFKREFFPSILSFPLLTVSDCFLIPTCGKFAQSAKTS
jgi:hypothetical protein